MKKHTIFFKAYRMFNGKEDEVHNEMIVMFKDVEVVESRGKKLWDSYPEEYKKELLIFSENDRIILKQKKKFN